MQNIRQMKIGTVYTMVAFTVNGLPYMAQFALLSMRCDSYEEWSESYVLSGKRIGGRFKGLLVRLNEGKQFVIWEGLVKPDIHPVVRRMIKDGDGGHVTIEKRWAHNDPRYMFKAIASVLPAPMVKNIREVVGPETLYDLCTVVS